ncbi:unnamed protein product [Amoebophrya sp. A25]|nr:unnamed protein product [Amoebophrya sp. A25]|eukprot:GSA25T00018995001.1
MFASISGTARTLGPLAAAGCSAGCLREDAATPSSPSSCRRTNDVQRFVAVDRKYKHGEGQALSQSSHRRVAVANCHHGNKSEVPLLRFVVVPRSCPRTTIDENVSTSGHLFRRRTGFDKTSFSRALRAARLQRRRSGDHGSFLARKKGLVSCEVRSWDLAGATQATPATVQSARKDGCTHARQHCKEPRLSQEPRQDDCDVVDSTSSCCVGSRDNDESAARPSTSTRIRSSEEEDLFGGGNRCVGSTSTETSICEEPSFDDTEADELQDDAGPSSKLPKIERVKSMRMDRGLYIRESVRRFEDSYSGEKAIGEGGFASVFKCRHKLTGVNRAAKRISKEVLKADWGMFENEVRNLITLDHPHIVKLLEYFDDGKDIVLVFELCRGPDLFDRIVEVLRKKGKFSNQEAGRLLKHMLKAVFCCHSLGIVHRDIKPENFMFASADKNSSLKLIDLGLSVSTGAGAGGLLKETDEDCIEGERGTVAYMPPEMLAGMKYDRRVDIWGLGIILYIMLTGEPLFTLGAEDDEVKTQILNPAHQRKKMRKKRKGLDPDAYDLLEKMLERDHHHRIDAKEALEHPFVKKAFDAIVESDVGRAASGKATTGGSRQNNRLSMDEVITRMDAFAQLPLLKRASIMVLAHLTATDNAELAAHRATFRQLDIDGNGTLTVAEFMQAMKSQGDTEFGVPRDFLESTWRGVDLNRSNDINFTEFIAATLDWRTMRDEHFRGVFQVLDADGSGRIDLRDLQILFPENGKKDLLRIMTDFGVPEGGYLTLEKFTEIMKR